MASSMCGAYRSGSLHRGVCNNLEPFRDGQKGFRVDEIQESADEGCSYCSVIAAALRRFVPNLNDDQTVQLWIKPLEDENPEIYGEPLEAATRAEAPTGEVAGLQCLEVTLGVSKDVHLSQEIQYETATINLFIFNPPDINPPTVPTLGTIKARPGRSDAGEGFDFVRKMLQQCLREHEQCVHPSSPDPPRRLLSIRGDAVRLVEAPAPGCSDEILRTSMGNYAALSHCWGPALLIQTTSDTIDEFRQEIPWSRLCATFQDGITVARQLGLDWIWIDALCIIQHDAHDWDVEAAKMSQYYSNAHVTIMASSSPAGAMPFLGPRDRKWTAARFEGAREDGSTFALEARLMQAREFDGSINSWGPLTTRAWTFQEHLLSPRTVHFTPAEVIWDCREDRQSECGVLYINKYESLHPTPRAPGIWWEWYQMVQRYTTRRLTVQSDRLPAIGGVAQAIHKGTGSEYLAGLWRDDLLKGLCWSIDLDRIRDHGAPIYDGNEVPSWSWASVNAPIAYLEDDIGGVDPNQPDSSHFLASVVGAECQLRGVSSFGRVSGGSVTLKADMAPVVLSCSDSLDWANGYTIRAVDPGSGHNKGSKGGRPKAARMSPDGRLGNTSRNDPVRSGADLVRRLQEPQLADVTVAYESRVYAVPLAQTARNNLVYGLVLGRVGQERGEDRYTRLGSFLVTRKKLTWLKDATKTEITIA